ncbi:MAG: AAA family ATPase [Candidatus Omnitrophica bacterium]|jgi:general secretion pathway protein A|nr:AAA family ATPase [Candidatus Omnitrophota bacterium]MDD5253352.1 AAA family ATPase [Candidatus Omnitrophota bacterium]
MSYFAIIGLNKEPFSTSPDPNFFYESSEHRAALMRLVIEVRLKRGLSVVLGDVGTGKTTLSRKLFQMLKERDDIIFHMILDPTFDTEEIFLDSLVRTFGIEIASPHPTILDYKEAIKRYLFEQGAEKNKTVVLLIDEAQKLNSLSLEALRMLLNYETNEFKLLQLVILGQMELLPRLTEIRNLIDRVSLLYTLSPFGMDETREMIEFRVRQAGYNGREKLFSEAAIMEIFKYTEGYPRRIGMLCHKALKLLVMKNKLIVDNEIIKELIEHEANLRWQKTNLLLKNSY